MLMMLKLQCSEMTLIQCMCLYTYLPAVPLSGLRSHLDFSFLSVR